MAARRISFRLTGGGYAFLLLCIALSVGAFNANLNIIYLLVSLVMAIFLVSVVAPVWNLLGLTCRRSTSKILFAGEPFEVRLWLYSRRRTVARVISVEEPLGAPQDGSGRPAKRLAIAVPPRRKVCLFCEAAPRSRGIHRMPYLRWSSGFPFGLAEFALRIVRNEDLLVYPARGRLSAAAAASLRPRDIRMGMRARAGLPGDEFRVIREYRPGDNPRRIHWRVSAHLGKTYVREMEHERFTALMILLDSRIPKTTRRSDRREAAAALELAISFAAEVCRTSLNEGNPITLVGFFPEPKAVIAHSPQDMRLVYEALARLRPSDAETADALKECGEAAGLSSVREVVGVTPNACTAEGLRRSLGGTRAWVHVAGDPDFSKVFRLTHQHQETGHEP